LRPVTAPSTRISSFGPSSRPTTPVKAVGSANGRTGTLTAFKPDPQVFETLDFDFATLEQRLRETAFLTRGLRISIEDERGEGDDRRERNSGDDAPRETMEKAIISKGNVQLSSDDVEKAAFDVQALVDEYDGEITDRQTGTDKDGEVRMARLVIRVPAKDFGAAFTDLERVADLRKSTSTSEDVTSAQRLLTALDTLFGDARLGHEEIGYEATRAAPHHVEPGLETSHKPHPLRVRQVWRERFAAEDLSGKGAILQPAALSFIAEDLAADVRHRLANETRFPNWAEGNEFRSIRDADRGGS
jgi:hypothetical protein